MLYKRKNPDDNKMTLCYKFDIEIEPVPDSVFDTARAMRELWNRLVEAGDRVAEKVRDLDKTARKPFYDDLDVELYRITAATPFARGMFHWKWAVLNRYQDARKAAMSGKRDWPKVHGGPLRKIKIPYATPTGSKIPFASDWLYKESGHVYIRSVPESAYYLSPRARDDSGKRMRGTRGFIDVADDRIDFRVTLDRPLPVGALLTRYALCGKSRGRLGWEWSIELTLRCLSDATAIYAPRTSRMAALDVGWRKFDDYLRIGALADSDGRLFEIRLPFDLSGREERRMCQHLAGYEECSRDRLYVDFRQIAGIQEKRDGSLETLKKKLTKLMPTLPKELQITGEAWRLTRQAGIRRLWYGRRESETRVGLRDVDGCDEAKAVITEWMPIDDRAQRDIASLWLKLERKRKDIYRRIAVWLANRYDVLIIESDLNLIGMQEDDNGGVSKAAKKHKNMASLYSFRQHLDASFSKRGKELRGRETAYSTQTCAQCGAHIEPGVPLMLECESGHRVDQDFNAVVWWVGETLGVSVDEWKARAVTGFDASVDRSHVSRYIVPVSVGDAGL